MWKYSSLSPHGSKLPPTTQVKVNVILCLTISQSVCPGVRLPSGTCDQFCLSLPWKLSQTVVGFFIMEHPLWRVCNLKLLLSFISVVFIWSQSHRAHEEREVAVPHTTYKSKSESKLSYGWWSVRQSALVLGHHPGPMTNFYFSSMEIILKTFAGFFLYGAPSLMWAWVCNFQRSHSSVDFTVSFVTQVPVFVFPRGKLTQLYPQAVDSLFIAYYDLEG
jgi:hypothetical protein